MIDESVTIEVKTSKVFEVLPENIYQVECLDVSSKQEKNKYKDDQIDTVLTFQFTLLAGKEKDGSPARGRNLWRNYVPNYFWNGKRGKNVLWQITEALLGRELKEDEAKVIDNKAINSLVGKQCRVVVKNKVIGDKTWNNIDSFLSVESTLDSLTDEEKDKATVKAKKELDVEEVDFDDLPVAGEVTIEEAEKALGKN